MKLKQINLITGQKCSFMETIKILGQASPTLIDFDIPATEIIYVVPDDKGCVVSYLNIVNRTNFDVNIRIQVGSAENLTYNEEITWMEFDMIVYAKCSAQRLKGVTLAAGDIVQITSNADYVTFALFGSEFDQNFSYTGDESGGYGYGYSGY